MFNQLVEVCYNSSISNKQRGILPKIKNIRGVLEWREQDLQFAEEPVEGLPPGAVPQGVLPR